MVVEQASIDVENRNQPKLATALDTAKGLPGRRFGNGLLCQQVTPAQIEPDPHLNPSEFQAAVGTGEAVVA